MYDVSVIGGGAAGISAAIYSARYKLNTLLISKDIGGLTLIAHLVENYPGFKSITGPELMNKFEEHLKSYNVTIKKEEVYSIKKNKNFIIETENNKYEAKTIILALGTIRKKLNLLNEDKFFGRGLSYCHTCDAPLFFNKTVAVVGAGDSALSASLLLTEYAKKIYLINKKNKFEAEPLILEKLKNNKKIEIIFNINLRELKGDKFLKSIILDNKKELKVDGLFIEIGYVPSQLLIKELKLKIDKNNYIIVNEKKETNVKGIYAVGDITNTPLRQIVTAAADGAIAATSAYNYLKIKK